MPVWLEMAVLFGDSGGNYTYDPFGRRISKTTAQGTVYFLYDDTGLIAEYDTNGNLISEYHYRPNSTWMTDPLFKRDGSNNRVHYYYNGHLGQPLKLFDRSGAITWEADWQAFGAVVITTEGAINNLRFPGQYFDAETGLYYNWHRYYDASTGRYVSSDPMGIFAGNNYYRYAAANPLTFVDPYGLFCLPPWAREAIASGAGGFVGGFIGSGGNPWAAVGYAAVSAGIAGGLTSGMFTDVQAAGLSAIGMGAVAGVSGGGPRAALGMAAGAIGGAVSGGQGAASGDLTKHEAQGLAGFTGGVFGPIVAGSNTSLAGGLRGGLGGVLGSMMEDKWRELLDKLCDEDELANEMCSI